MKRSILTLSLLVAAGFSFKADGHDVITTAITWNREISRIVYERCASCHREGGRAFSLMTYAEARPWAAAIKEEVLERRMPPWGAIKGFGEFRNDQALTSEQLEMITSWAEGGAPEGDAKDLKPAPKPAAPAAARPTKGSITITGDFKLPKALTLDGLIVQKAPESESFQLEAEFPDGATEPLLWIYEYKPAYKHPFLFRSAVDLPRGTVIRGAPTGSSIVLLPKK
jgi:hypothetical protein